MDELCNIVGVENVGTLVEVGGSRGLGDWLLDNGEPLEVDCLEAELGVSMSRSVSHMSKNAVIT